MTEVIDTPEDESIAAKYWHDLYKTTLKNAQDYAAKVGEDIGRLERELQISQGYGYEKGFLDGAQHQMKSSVDKAVNAMSQTEQEPVAWMTDYENIMHANDHARWGKFDGGKGFERFSDYVIPLYTAPPQRPWVGLTDEEALDCAGWSVSNIARNAEAKLKETNT